MLILADLFYCNENKKNQCSNIIIISILYVILIVIKTKGETHDTVTNVHFIAAFHFHRKEPRKSIIPYVASYDVVYVVGVTFD